MACTFYTLTAGSSSPKQNGGEIMSYPLATIPLWPVCHPKLLSVPACISSLRGCNLALCTQIYSNHLSLEISLGVIHNSFFQTWECSNLKYEKNYIQKSIDYNTICNTTHIRRTLNVQ